MKHRPFIIGVSLCAGLLLGLGFLFQVRHLRQQQRREVWLAYVRGPLELYVQGSREGALLLGPKRLKAVQRAHLGDAVEALRDSWTQAVAQQQDFQADAFFYDLDQAVLWHTSASQLADTWTKLDRSNSSEMETARLAAQGMHRNLGIKVRNQWEEAQEELPWSPAERKESQAAVDAVSAPLPYE